MKNIYIKILLIILLIPQIFVAQTQKISELENKRKILKEEILKINSLLIDNSKKKKNAFNDLENLTFKIIRKEELIKLTNQQINLLNSDVKKNEEKIEKLNIEILRARKDYAKMIFNSYKSRLKESRLMFLLSSQNFLQAFKRSQYFDQFSKSRREIASSIQSNVKNVKASNDTLKIKISQKEYLIESNENEKKKLSNEKKDQNNLINSLSKRESSYKKQINDKQKRHLIKLRKKHRARSIKKNSSSLASLFTND